MTHLPTHLPEFIPIRSLSHFKVPPPPCSCGRIRSQTQSHPSPPPLYLSVSEQTLFVLSETQTQYFPTAIEPPSPLNLPARFIHPSQLYQCSSCLPIPLSLPVRAAQDNGRLLWVLFSCVVVIVVFMVSLSASQAHCIPTGC